MPVISAEVNAHTDEHLRDDQVIWLTTVRSDGQPQSIPVWFLWNGETFLIYSRPNQQKLRNIRGNPRVALNLNLGTQGNKILRIEGTADIEASPPIEDTIKYTEKYRSRLVQIGCNPNNLAHTFLVAIRVTPVRWYDW